MNKSSGTVQSVTGCASETKPTEPGSDPAAQEDAYKLIRLAHSYDATTLDPQNCCDDGSYFVINNICEPLVIGYDGEVHPGVAETWDVSEDGKVYTFHLRKSNWSDGTPVSAHDFVYAVTRALDPNVAYENVYTFYSLLNGESYGSEADKVLNNGPFTCTEWLHESKTTIKKNENYWNAANVKIDEVQYIVGVADQVAVDRFMANDLDVGFFLDKNSVDALTAMGLPSEPRLSSSNFI